MQAKTLAELEAESSNGFVNKQSTPEWEKAMKAAYEKRKAERTVCEVCGEDDEEDEPIPYDDDEDDGYVC